MRISRYFGAAELGRIASDGLRLHARGMQEAPHGSGFMLQALLEHFEEPWQVEIAGDPSQASWRAFRRVLGMRWWPARMTARIVPGEGRRPFPWMIEAADAEVAKVYLCKGKTCLLPAKDPGQLEEFLRDHPPYRK